MNSRLDFFNFTLAELETWCRDRGLPPYRARQIFQNAYQRGIRVFEEMTDLPKALRSELPAVLNIEGPAEAARTTSDKDGSTKLLWTLADGKQIESVVMSADYGQTLCFSTQVGCAFNCSFCITAKMGRIRHLTAGEIVAQVVAADRLRERPEDGSKLPGANLVAMGMGEPMDNLDAVLRASDILAEPLGMNISPRRMTVSTVGVVPGIRRLTREKPSLGLALSLNATTNEVRRKLMPVTKKWPIESLLPVLEEYTRASGRRVTLEYVLIRGLNDTREDAERLGRLAQRFPSKVNIIPFNPSELFPYQRPTPAQVDAFARTVWPYRTTVTVRYSKGLDIQAACGQLGYGQVKEKLAAGA